MPITMTGRSINTGNLSPMIPIVANNPAFKVQIVSVDGRLEQKPNAEPDSAQQDAIKVGDYISGETVSSDRNPGQKVAGKVLQILRNGQDIYAYKILDAESEEVEVDPTTACKESTNGQVDSADEGYVLSYEGWLVENNLNESDTISGKEIIMQNQGLSRSEDGSAFIADAKKFKKITIPLKDINNTAIYSWYVKHDMDEDLNIIDRLIKKIESGVKLHPIVIDKDNKILDGNHRFVAYRKLRYKNIDVYKEF